MLAFLLLCIPAMKPLWLCIYFLRPWGSWLADGKDYSQNKTTLVFFFFESIILLLSFFTPRRLSYIKWSSMSWLPVEAQRCGKCNRNTVKKLTPFIKWSSCDRNTLLQTAYVQINRAFSLCTDIFTENKLTQNLHISVIRWKLHVINKTHRKWQK